MHTVSLSEGMETINTTRGKEANVMAVTCTGMPNHVVVGDLEWL
jgi:hypothetical protein